MKTCTPLKSLSFKDPYANHTKRFYGPELQHVVGQNIFLFSGYAPILARDCFFFLNFDFLVSIAD